MRSKSNNRCALVEMVTIMAVMMERGGSQDIKNNDSSSYNTNKCCNGGICLFLRFNKIKKTEVEISLL